MKKCAKCKQQFRNKEPDPCLGYLPGVAHACCGHGIDRKAYCVGWKDCKPSEPVYREDGRWVWKNNSWYYETDRPGFFLLRGKDAIEFFKSII